MPCTATSQCCPSCPPVSRPATNGPGSTGGGDTGGAPPPPCNCGCPCCKGNADAGPGIEAANAAIESVSMAATPLVPGTKANSPSINPQNGNLVYEFTPPTSGPYDPRLKLTYNSRAADTAIQFGSGVADLWNPTVTSIDASTALVIDGVGSAFTYTSKDGSGRYVAPAGTVNALTLNGDNTWTETLPDGMARTYDTTGALKKLVNPSGGRWTILRSSGLLSSILSPINTRTTYAYTGGNLLRRTQDSSGRITTFTIDATSSNLKRVTWPDTTITSLAYDSSHRLTVYTPQ